MHYSLLNVDFGTFSLSLGFTVFFHGIFRQTLFFYHIFIVSLCHKLCKK